MTPIKIYCIKFSKFRKFVNPNISYSFVKTLISSIICSKFRYNNERISKHEGSIEILKFLV